MPIFIVVGAPGSGIRGADGSASFNSAPVRMQLEFEAENRAMAYVHAHRYWSSLNLDVAARTMGEDDSSPLLFSDQELGQIESEGVSVKENFPDGDGIQVENIHRKTDEAA